MNHSHYFHINTILLSFDKKQFTNSGSTDTLNCNYCTLFIFWAISTLQRSVFGGLIELTCPIYSSSNYPSKVVILFSYSYASIFLHDVLCISNFQLSIGVARRMSIFFFVIALGMLLSI